MSFLELVATKYLAIDAPAFVRARLLELARRPPTICRVGRDVYAVSDGGPELIFTPPIRPHIFRKVWEAIENKGCWVDVSHLIPPDTPTARRRERLRDKIERPLDRLAEVSPLLARQLRQNLHINRDGTQLLYRGAFAGKRDSSFG